MLDAVGLVAAAQSLPADWCQATRPVPAIAFHGTADPMVPYAGGPLGDPLNPVKPIFPPVRQWVGAWAARNGCGSEAGESAVAAGVARTVFPDCDAGADVVLYTVDGGGHSWPGGRPPPAWRVGPTSDAIDATRAMWDFFRAHPLAAAAAGAASR